MKSFKLSLSEDHALAAFIWIGYAFAEFLFFPAMAPAEWRVGRDLEDVFVYFYWFVPIVCVAFSLADRLLPANRYVFYALSSATIIIMSALFLEFVVAPALFNSPSFMMGAYVSGGEAATLTLLLLAGRLLLHRRRNERRLRELALATVETELRYLKSQMNPHVLFNALNNIYAHALEGSERTPQLILKLSEILRFTIYDCSSEQVTLDKEIAFLADYVDIQKLAAEGRGDVSFAVTGCVEYKTIAPLLLIPFVENCFKHSLDTMDKGIRVHVDIDIRDDELHMTCVNNHDYTKRPDVAETFQGLGLANVKRRLDLLFSGDYELSIRDVDNLFRVQLCVPLR